MNKFVPARVIFNSTCNYCLGKGHWKLNCPVLKSKSNGGKGLSGGTSRPHALAVPVGGGQGALGLDAENMCPEKPAMVASVVPSLPVVVEVPGFSEGSSLLWADMVPPDYSEFIREGFVSLVGRSQKVPVKILRDTGVQHPSFSTLCWIFLRSQVWGGVF